MLHRACSLSSQLFAFVQRDGFVESEQEIPEPHEFVARLLLGHEHHSHTFDVEYVELNHHHHAIFRQRPVYPPKPPFVPM